MKRKFSLMGRVAIALVLALSLCLMMAVPVAADVSDDDVDPDLTSFSPQDVKPRTTDPYTIVVTDSAGFDAGSDATVVTISIPTVAGFAAFVVSPGTLAVDSTPPGDGEFTIVGAVPDGSGNSTTIVVTSTNPGVIPSNDTELTITFNATSPAEDGAYVWAVEMMSLAATDTDTGTVTVDSVNPTVTIDTITEYANPAEITGTASDAGSGVDKVELTIVRDEDGFYWGPSWQEPEALLLATITDGTWSYTSSGVSFADDKSYTVTAKATDVAGNVTDPDAQPSQTFLGDSTNPEVAITTLVDTPTSVAPSVIEGTASDELSGVQKVEVKLEFAGPYYWDGYHWVVAESWAPATGTETWSFAVPTLTSERTYTVTAKSTDNAGNESTLDTLSFDYDTGAPTVAIAPPLVEYYTADELTAIAGTSSDAVKVEVLLKDDTASLYWDGVDSWVADETWPWLEVSTPDSWSFDVIALSDTLEANGEFSDGNSYTVTAKATDDATPANFATAQATFTYDISAPTVTIDNIPDYVVSLDEITGTASDAGSGVDTVELTIQDNIDEYWNGGSWVGPEALLLATITDGTWSYTITGTPFADGKNYIVTAKATDALSLTTAPADQLSDSFTVDSLPTIDSITIAEFVETLDEIVGTASDAVPGAVTLVQLKIKNTTDSTYWTGAAWGAEAWFSAAGTDSWSYDTSGISFADGSYTVYAKSKDNVSQWSVIAEESFAYDTTAPTVTITDIPAEAKPTYITGTASDAGSGVDTVELTIQDNIDEYWNGGSWVGPEALLLATITDGTWSYTITGTPFADGKNYIVTAKATDALSLTTAPADQPSDTFTYGGTPTITEFVVLSEGWNLISLPLIPADSNIDKVLANLITLETVEQVQTYSVGDWLKWATSGPNSGDGATLSLMKDGVGFWVEMTDAGELVVSGYELCEPAPAVPPEYPVVVGWNLIGYKFAAPGKIDAYLGKVIHDDLQAIYGYDASAGAYFIPGITDGHTGADAGLELGYGYWISLTKPGTIYPTFVDQSS